MSDSVRPHRRQPTRLLHPLDFPGKSTGMGCHFLLQCIKVKSKSEVTQSCPTLHDAMDCSPPGSSIDGIFQARGPEWGAIAFSASENQGVNKMLAGRTESLNTSHVTPVLLFYVSKYKGGYSSNIIKILSTSVSSIRMK